MEACHNSYLSKNHIVARFSWGSSETQSLFSKQSLNKYLLPLGALVTSQTQLDVSNVPIVDEDKIGVLLLNLGGPETLDDVQPFLFNLFADPVTSFRFFFFFFVFNASQIILYYSLLEYSLSSFLLTIMFILIHQSFLVRWVRNFDLIFMQVSAFLLCSVTTYIERYVHVEWFMLQVNNIFFSQNLKMIFGFPYVYLAISYTVISSLVLIFLYFALHMYTSCIQGCTPF